MKEFPEKRFKNESVPLTIAVGLLILLVITAVIYMKDMSPTKVKAKETPAPMATNQADVLKADTGKVSVEVKFHPTIK